jgi:hypothetical protein
LKEMAQDYGQWWASLLQVLKLRIQMVNLVKVRKRKILNWITGEISGITILICACNRNWNVFYFITISYHNMFWPLRAIFKWNTISIIFLWCYKCVLFEDGP